MARHSRAPGSPPSLLLFETVHARLRLLESVAFW